MRHFHRLCGTLVAAFIATASQAAPPTGTSSATAAYRQEHQQRLAARSDRDSRIAAALLGLPRNVDDAPIRFDPRPLQTLLQPFSDDELALYVSALICHLSSDCSDAAAVDRLTARAPKNALHWLLRPGAQAPSTAIVHQATRTDSANPHLGELFAVMNRALAGTAADQRNDALTAIPLQRFAPTLNVCKGAEATLREDCIAVGRRLFADAHGSILTRMIGSVLLRRLAKGTDDEATAVAFRRAYVWLGEHAIGDNPNDDTMRADTERYGEWEAWLRAADRAGVARTPPADWTAKNPQSLLLSEDRRPTGG